MNAFKLLMAASCFLGLATSGVAKQDYSKSEGLLQYVDPYIGSGFHGHVFVGTSVPYGMVQLGPNNIHKGWDWCSGYHYSDSILIGFSHTPLKRYGMYRSGGYSDYASQKSVLPEVTRMIYVTVYAFEILT